MSYDHMDAQHATKSPKEMRTVRREGNVVTEDYERLNPDGTVTKTITTTDEKTGQETVTVYKMDKSGIVRKVDEVDAKLWAEAGAKKEAMLQYLKDKMVETRDNVEAMKKQSEKENSKSVVYERVVPYNRNGVAYSKRVEEEEPDKHEMAFNMRNINTPIELTAKQQAMIRDHKENILNYGTQKLIKQLNKKLSDDKFNEVYPLTDEQKDKVIEYGVRKLHRLLEKNLDDERLIYDVMSFNPDFGKVDLSGRGSRQIPGDQSVSFSLNPYQDVAQEDIAKPISFSMRPEKPTNPLPEPDKYADRKAIDNGYSALWNKLMNPKNNIENVDHTKHADDNRGKKSEANNERYDSASEEHNDQVDYKKLKHTVRKLIEEDELYKKSPLTQEQKEGIVNYALQQMRTVFRDSVKIGEEALEESSKRKQKINLLEYFDEDEIYAYGKRALKKLVRRSLKAFDIDQDMLRQVKLDDPEQSKRRDAFYQYLGDVIEGRVKESDLLPVPISKDKQSKQIEEPKEDTKWDYKSLLSSIFGQKEKDKSQVTEGKPKEPRNKITDIDSLFSWLKSDKEDSTDTDKVQTQSSVSVPKAKPRFYQLEPQPTSKNHQNQNESEDTSFDLKSLLKKIQEAAVRKFSEPKSTETIESTGKKSIPYQENVQSNVNNSNINSHERELKQADVDAALSRIRQNNSETSTSRGVTNKPPYLKERISGLNSIPRPKITTASPSVRNVDYSDQVSFQLKPHNNDSNNKQEDKPRSLENQRVETGSSHEQDFQPWWFESPESFVKKVITEKPLIKEGFIDAPMINSSFSTVGNGFPTGGSFTHGNLLH